jgi:chemotaxis protein histidine kinase CheA
MRSITASRPRRAPRRRQAERARLTPRAAGWATRSWSSSRQRPGIDWLDAAERARRCGLPCASQAEPVDALFHDGGITQDTATKVSGRRVGLSALRHACVTTGGHATITSRVGAGTSLAFRWPSVPARPETLQIADQRRSEVTKVASDRMMFKFPSLRNVARTARYFHDESARTLEQAVTLMARHQLGEELARARSRRS